MANFSITCEMVNKVLGRQAFSGPALEVCCVIEDVGLRKLCRY
jgi:hypothetical protein